MISHTFATLPVQMGLIVPLFSVLVFNVDWHQEPTPSGKTELSHVMTVMMLHVLSLSYFFGLYSAADTLVPRAIGAGNAHYAARICLTGWIVSLALYLPVVGMVLCVLYLTGSFNVLASSLKLDVDASIGFWLAPYLVTLPFLSLHMAIYKFLSAQTTMRPLVMTCLVSNLLILPISTNIFVARLGLRGTMYSLAFCQILQAGRLIAWVWQTGVCRNSTDIPLLHQWDMRRYSLLGIGGILANTESLYWAAWTLGYSHFNIGLFEVLMHGFDVAVLLVISFCIGCFCNAWVIRMGLLLPHNTEACRKLTVAGWFFTVPFVVAFVMVCYMAMGYKNMRLCVVLFLVIMNKLNSGIATGLGMQWTLGVMQFICLWCVGLMAVYYPEFFLMYKMAGWDEWVLPYLMMNIALPIMLAFTDWKVLSQASRPGESRGADLEPQSSQEANAEDKLL